MRFTVRGRVGQEEASVTYDDGELSGTDSALRRTRQVLQSAQTVQLSPQDPARPASPEDPRAVLAAIQEALDEVSDVEGDYPMPEADSSAS
ncbi:MAG: hypothetical protein M3N68_12895 [Actinomycetota bacterium]|nr:hypothetical protein [Actinomycetota bacterium]